MFKLLVILFTVLENFRNSQESNCGGVSFLTNLHTFKTPTQVFSCEYHKIIKNNYFEEELQMGASEFQKSVF